MVYKTVVALVGEFVLQIMSSEVAAWNLCTVITRIYNNAEAEINNTDHLGINDKRQHQRHEYFTRYNS
jgi:hypothetical protein